MKTYLCITLLFISGILHGMQKSDNNNSAPSSASQQQARDQLEKLKRFQSRSQDSSQSLDSSSSENLEKVSVSPEDIKKAFLSSSSSCIVEGLKRAKNTLEDYYTKDLGTLSRKGYEPNTCTQPLVAYRPEIIQKFNENVDASISYLKLIRSYENKRYGMRSLYAQFTGNIEENSKLLQSFFQDSEDEIEEGASNDNNELTSRQEKRRADESGLDVSSKGSKKRNKQKD